MEDNKKMFLVYKDNAAGMSLDEPVHRFGIKRHVTHSPVLCVECDSEMTIESFIDMINSTEPCDPEFVTYGVRIAPSDIVAVYSQGTLTAYHLKRSGITVIDDFFDNLCSKGYLELSATERKLYNAVMMKHLWDIVILIASDCGKYSPHCYQEKEKYTLLARRYNKEVRETSGSSRMLQVRCLAHNEFDRLKYDMMLNDFAPVNWFSKVVQKMIKKHYGLFNVRIKMMRNGTVLFNAG